MHSRSRQAFVSWNRSVASSSSSLQRGVVLRLLLLALPSSLRTQEQLRQGVHLLHLTCRDRGRRGGNSAFLSFSLSKGKSLDCVLDDARHGDTKVRVGCMGLGIEERRRIEECSEQFGTFPMSLRHCPLCILVEAASSFPSAPFPPLSLKMNF